MSTITIEVPESVLLATGQSREAFTGEARFLLAAKLFELERLSSGKAAQLCGMAHPDFLLAVGQLGIPVVRLAGEELDREFRGE
jgi:predicted HTH domain antitoxin